MRFAVPLRHRILAPALLLCLGAAGCGGSDRLPLHPARGQVLLEGKPLPHALVVLHPLDSSKNPTRPRATVEESGVFRLSTYETGDGAPAGEYAVTLTCWRSPAKGRGGPADEAPPTNILPARYGQPQTSGLQVRIEAGDNDIPSLNLKK